MACHMRGGKEYLDPSTDGVLVRTKRQLPSTRPFQLSFLVPPRRGDGQAFPVGRQTGRNGGRKHSLLLLFFLTHVGVSGMTTPKNGCALPSPSSMHSLASSGLPWCPDQVTSALPCLGRWPRRKDAGENEWVLKQRIRSKNMLS